MVVGIAIRDVFRQRASVEYMKRMLQRSLQKDIDSFGRGIFIGIFFVIHCCSLGISFVLGEQWKEAGVYARVLSP
ncbi:MAG: hypothetical protein V8R91_06470, partial [Butyricimonas faecihominis]